MESSSDPATKFTTSAEDIFVQLCEDFGGVYTGDDESVNALNYLCNCWINSSYGWHTTNDKSRPIHAGIVRTTQLNGFATYEQGLDFIGIHKGTSTILSAVFNALMVISAPCTDDTSCEDESSVKYWDQLPRDISAIVDDVTEPSDGMRHRTANYCVACAYTYLILHELGHVRHGHFRFQTEGYKPAGKVHDERTEYSASSESTITRQTLEMDADSFAVWQSLNFVKLCYTKPEYALGSIEQAFGWWIYAVFVLMKLFRPAEVSVKNVDMMVHPPTRVRQMWFFQAVLTACSAGEIPIDCSDVFKLLFATAKQVDRDAKVIAPNDPDTGSLATAQEPEIDAHLVKLKEHWAVLRPLLLEVCYVTNLTPAEDSL